MNWSFINNRRTPGSSHVLHVSNELLQIDFMCSLLCFAANTSHSSSDHQYIVPSVKVWLEFLRKRGYLWSYCVGLERLIAHSHTWWVLRTWRMLDWMIQKKKCHSPFNCSLMKPAFLFIFFLLSALFFSFAPISPVCTHRPHMARFQSGSSWIQTSYGRFHSHMGGCDNVTPGLWHTWVNNTAAWESSDASDES